MLLSRLLFSKLPINACAKVSLEKFSRFVSSNPFQGHQIYNAVQIAMMKQRQVKKRKTEEAIPQLREGSSEEVLDFEVRALLAKTAKDGNATESTNGDGTIEERPERSSEIELDITELSSTGDGLAVSPSGGLVYVVPFSIPGDRVLAKVTELHRFKLYAHTDFIKVISPSPRRKDAGIGCKYFSTCSGCQLQMLSYDDQLAHKKTILEKAYKNFSGLDPSLVPPISDTYGSPLEYNYRTKLTPHFDGPKGPKGQRKFTEVPPIGFTIKGQRRVMEIEDCPIGTPIVREGLKLERAKVATNIHKYKNGATILVRESTQRTPKTTSAPYAIKGDTEHLTSASEPTSITTDSLTGRPVIHKEFPTYIEEKTYISNMNETSIEYIDDWKFTNRAGSFFQNNNSILSKFTAYVRGHALPPAPNLATEPSVKYLLDAYCGTGLFAITLSTLFKSTLGVDIDSQAIFAARANAIANNLFNIGFIEADASALFAGVPFPPAETVIVIDPPRKGCSEDFLNQLLGFGPKRVVYVSCNVHSQARDVGVLVQGNGNGNGKGTRYEIESLRGFDFFPQTGHVEGVAFLNRI